MKLSLPRQSRIYLISVYGAQMMHLNIVYSANGHVLNKCAIIQLSAREGQKLGNQ